MFSSPFRPLFGGALSNWSHVVRLDAGILPITMDHKLKKMQLVVTNKDGSHFNPFFSPVTYQDKEKARLRRIPSCVYAASRTLYEQSYGYFGTVPENVNRLADASIKQLHTQNFVNSIQINGVYFILPVVLPPNTRTECYASPKNMVSVPDAEINRRIVCVYWYQIKKALLAQERKSFLDVTQNKSESGPYNAKNPMHETITIRLGFHKIDLSADFSRFLRENMDTFDQLEKEISFIWKREIIRQKMAQDQTFKIQAIGFFALYVCGVALLLKGADSARVARIAQQIEEENNPIIIN